MYVPLEVYHHDAPPFCSDTISCKVSDDVGLIAELSSTHADELNSR